MNVGTLCRRGAVSVSMSAPLSTVAALMMDEHVGAIIVTRGGDASSGVAGIITDRDIMRAQLERTADLTRLSAGETMTRDPLILDERDSVGGAVAHLRARGVRRAPVVSAEGKLIGLVSVDDLLAYFATTLIDVAGVVAQQVERERT